jgi:hypothetical protein
MLLSAILGQRSFGKIKTDNFSHKKIEPFIYLIIIQILLEPRQILLANRMLSALQHDRISPRQAAYYKAIVKWQDRLGQ